MIAKYPPLEIDEPELAVADEPIAVDAFDHLDPNDLDWVRDALWVYSHIEGSATPADAPSRGAWSLLRWATKYRTQFYERIFPKALAARDGDAGDRDMIVAEQKSIAELRKVLDQFKDAAKQKSAPLVEKSSVNLVADWLASHAEAEVLSEHALAALTSRIIDFGSQLVSAA